MNRFIHRFTEWSEVECQGLIQRDRLKKTTRSRTGIEAHDDTAKFRLSYRRFHL